MAIITSASADAIFVHHDGIDEAKSYGGGGGRRSAPIRPAREFRRLYGWHEWAGDPRYTNEHWRMDRGFPSRRAPAEQDVAAR